MKNIIRCIWISLLLLVGFSFMFMPALENITLSILFGVLLTVLALAAFDHFDVIDLDFSMTADEKLKARMITNTISGFVAALLLAFTFLSFILGATMIVAFFLYPDDSEGEGWWLWAWIGTIISMIIATIIIAQIWDATDSTFEEEVILAEDSKTSGYYKYLRFREKPGQVFKTDLVDALFAKEGQRVKISYQEWDKNKKLVTLTEFKNADDPVLEQPNEAQTPQDQAREIREDLDNRLGNNPGWQRPSY